MPPTFSKISEYNKPDSISEAITDQIDKQLDELMSSPPKEVSMSPFLEKKAPDVNPFLPLQHPDLNLPRPNLSTQRV